MLFRYDPVEYAGQVDKESFDELSLAVRDLRMPAALEASDSPDDQEYFDLATAAFLPVTKALNDRPDSGAVQLDRVLVRRENAVSGACFGPHARYLHLDRPEPAAIEVVVANQQPTIFASGNIPADKAADSVFWSRPMEDREAYLLDYLRIDDLEILMGLGFAIQQALPYQASLLNSAAHMSAINLDEEATTRTLALARYVQAT